MPGGGNNIMQIYKGMAECGVYTTFCLKNSKNIIFIYFKDSKKF